MVTITMERVVTTKDYQFTVPSTNSGPNWELIYRNAVGNDKEKRPTYSEIFAVVQDIFSQTSEEECNSISFKFILRRYIFYRGTTSKLEFFESMFGNTRI